MAVLRLNVKCASCKQEVSQLEARRIPSVTKQPRYQCFLCFKRHQPITWGFGDEVAVKQGFYCERCRYKFSAKKAKCPYCGKGDQLEKSKVRVKDLL